MTCRPGCLYDAERRGVSSFANTLSDRLECRRRDPVRSTRHGWATICFIAGAVLAPASRAFANPTPVFSPLPGQLFDVPIRENGHFGDHRSNHFHAGLDLDTGGAVGRAVHAPADAVVRRVRASGVGYGRSIYLE